MTLLPEGGAALPVSVTTTRKVQGGAAIPVYGYMTAPTDGRPAMGGPAVPVRVLTAADLKVNGGQWTLEGRPYALPVYTAPASATVMGGPALAVYPVNAWPTVPVVVTPSSLLNGLIAYWNLDESSNGSGPVSRAAAVGGLTLTDTGNVTSVAGKNSNAAFPETTAKYLANTTPTILRPGDSDFSVAAWIQARYNGGTVIAGVGPNVSGGEWMIQYDMTYGISWALRNGSNVIDYCTNPTFGVHQLSTWYHVVGRYDSAADLIYITTNGTYTDTLAHTGGCAVTAQPFRIGTDGVVSGTCYVDEFGYWNRFLTNAECVSLYNGGLGFFYPFQ